MSVGRREARVSVPSVRNSPSVRATGNKRFLTAVASTAPARPCPALPCPSPSFLPSSALPSVAGRLGIGPDHEREQGEGEKRRFWQRQCNGRARGIGSVSYVFWGAYETVERRPGRGEERRGEAGRGRAETSRARWTHCVSQPGSANLCLGARVELYQGVQYTAPRCAVLPAALALLARVMDDYLSSPRLPSPESREYVLDW